MLTLLFIVLKLTGVIHWSWWWIPVALLLDDRPGGNRYYV